MGAGGDILGGVGGAIGNIAILAGAAGKGGEKFLKQATEAWEKLKLSDFDYTQLSPPELRLIQEYYPEEYSAVVPPDAQKVIDSQVGRQGQVEALNYFQGVRDNGLPLETRVQSEEAARSVGREGQANQAAILQALQARGRLGGGTEAAARLMGNQQSMELAGGLGANLARDAVMRRFDAADRAGGLAGSIRAGDVGVSAQNADISNRFNQWLAGLQTSVAADNADARERAKFANVGERQRISDTNEESKYDVDLANLMRKNSLLDTEFSQRLSKTQGLTGALGNMANARYAEQAARAESIRGIGQGVGRAVGGVADTLSGTGVFGQAMQDFTLNDNRRRAGYY